MRKILTQAERDRRSKRRTMIVTLLILGVLVLSSVGYAFMYATGDSQGSAEGESSVQDVGGQWMFKIGDQVHYVRSSPEQAANISVQIVSDISTYAGKTVYIVAENKGILSEIYSNLARYTARMQEACYENCTQDLPVKDCRENLIVWSESPENKVYQRDNCVFVEGDVRAADAFIYKIFEVN